MTKLQLHVLNEILAKLNKIDVDSIYGTVSNQLLADNASIDALRPLMLKAVNADIINIKNSLREINQTLSVVIEDTKN